MGRTPSFLLLAKPFISNCLERRRGLNGLIFFFSSRRASIGSTPSAFATFTRSRANRAADKLTEGYDPSAKRLSFPSPYIFKNQRFDPVGLTSRYRPEASVKRARFLSAGQVAFLHSFSVSIGGLYRGDMTQIGEQLPEFCTLPRLFPGLFPDRALAVIRPR